MTIPLPLIDCLVSVVKQNVFNVLSSYGVHCLLNCVVVAVMNILSDVGESGDECINLVQRNISVGQLIDTFSWMPGEWLLSSAKPSLTHNVLISQTDEEFNPANIMMRIEPLISNANRSIEVFKQLNDTLETLYSLETGTVLQSCMPVGFAFFTEEFTRYAEEALTNPEVAQILRELCEVIEPVTVKENTVCCQQSRKSIVDPDI